MNLDQYELNRQYRERLLREAENARLARQQPKGTSAVAPLLAGLGRQLVEVGQRLQQYEPDTSASPKQA